MAKLADHGNGIALVFARTDVRWWQDTAPNADIICLIAGRVRFYQGSTDKRGGTPGAGSALIGFGHKATTAIQNSGLGMLVKPIKEEHNA
jgi:hypothetical protein